MTHFWKCEECNREVTSNGGYDTTCECGAEYNSFGQRLREDWRGNPAWNNDEIDDMEGFEIQQLAKENDET